MQQRNAIRFFKQRGQEVKRNRGKSKLHSLFFSLFLVIKIPNGKPMGMLLVYSFLIKVKVVRQVNGM
jgi:hypothetical protein